MTNSFGADALAEWIVSIYLSDGRVVNLDMEELREVFVVSMPDSVGGHAVAVEWTEEGAQKLIDVVKVDRVNKDIVGDFQIKVRPIAPLSQLVRSMAEEKPPHRYIGSYMNRTMGDYKLVVDQEGRLFRHPKEEDIPDGYIEIKERVITYDNRLLTIFWTLPVTKKPGGVVIDT